MNRTEFIGKLQLCYFGDRNAYDKIVSVYDKQQEKIEKAIDKLYCWGDVLNIKFQEEMMKILKED